MSGVMSEGSLKINANDDGQWENWAQLQLKFSAGQAGHSRVRHIHLSEAMPNEILTART